MSRKSEPGQDEMSPFIRFSVDVRNSLPGLFRLMGKDAESVNDLRIKQRGEDDWLCVLRRYGDDGAPQVLFATGTDWLTCLWAADKLVQAGKWRDDKPWKRQG